MPEDTKQTAWAPCHAWGSVGSEQAGCCVGGRWLAGWALPCPRLHGPPVLSQPACPQDLATLLEQIGCLKYLQVFEEQDVDLRIFLTLTESDLKEIGIT